MNERVLGLDIGDVRIGVAVSDALRMIASPVEVMTRKGWGPDVKHVAELCARYDTTLVVSGLPLNMDGSAGFQSEKVKQFCAQLEKAGLTVYYQDERLTTVSAERSLLSGDMSRAERKSRVDKVAAALILQQWLDSGAQQGPESEGTAMADDKDLFEQDEYEEDGIIELIDEDGQTVPFQHLDTVEYKGEYYIVLLPAGEESDVDEDGGVLIMKITQDENGDDCYVTLEDEDVMEDVFDIFMQRMQDDEDYEVGDAPDDDTD